MINEFLKLMWHGVGIYMMYKGVTIYMMSGYTADCFITTLAAGFALWRLDILEMP